MGTRIIIAAFLVVIGFLSLRYTEPIVRTIGYNSWAERYLGGGGSYTMWKLLGIIFIVSAFLVLTGDLQFSAPQPSIAP